MVAPTILDLGCGSNKYPNSYGVDFQQLPGVDMVWDLNEFLPGDHWGKYSVVHTKCVLDHIGNPLNFLRGCYQYLQNDGKLILIIDNGNYWRYHVHLGNYHAHVWENDAPGVPWAHHKMMFQKEHLVKLLGLIGFKNITARYFRDYRGFLKGHVDYLFPKHLGRNMIRIEAQK